MENVVTCNLSIALEMFVIVTNIFLDRFISILFEISSGPMAFFGFKFFIMLCISPGVTGFSIIIGFGVLFIFM